MSLYRMPLCQMLSVIILSAFLPNVVYTECLGTILAPQGIIF
jgi:hypothetical protein